MDDRLIDEADQLCDRLMDLRAQWRGYPVMYARLKRMSDRAYRRLMRRMRCD